MFSGEPALPQTFGRYELLLRIGSGGMASVYLARVRGPGGFERDVAVKVTHPHLDEEADLLASLLQEARIAARIRHPNVVPVLDVGEHGAGAFLVMEYVEGEVLSGLARRERSANGRMPLPIALRVLGDALAGLHAAHELRDDRGELLGIVHRDFSPQNILVGVDGAARLTDFGIARVASLSSSTKSGFIKGKLGYVSPEQVRSPRSVDRRTDVWAAGVVAWELVTGRALRPREDEAATLLRIVSEEPPRARSACPELPEAIDEAIARALRIDPAERLSTADELRRLLVDAGVHRTHVADPAEVAEYVAQHAGEKLQARRRKMEQALAATGPRQNTPDPEDGPPRSEPPTRAELTTTPASERSAAGARRLQRWAVPAIALAGVGLGAALLFRPTPAQSGVLAGASARSVSSVAQPTPASTAPPPLASPSSSPSALPPPGEAEAVASALLPAGAVVPAAAPSPARATSGSPARGAGSRAAPRRAAASTRGAVATASGTAATPATAAPAPSTKRPALPADPLDDAR